MAVSVIVSNFNGSRFLPRLLDSLRAQRGVTTQILIVDRNSTDGSQQLLEQYPDVTVLQAPPELGLVAGYAIGVSRAQLENLFFCNEDMWFDPDCLKALESHLSVQRKVAIADPWQWDYGGLHVIHMGTQVRRRWDVHCPLPIWEMEQTPMIQSGQYTAMACAGAMMITRSAYLEIGGWDTSFFLDYEDLDLCIRAWQRGWRCVTVPEAKVYHALGASNGKPLPKYKGGVAKRRYIGGASNCITVAAKYFRWRWLPLALFARLEQILRNLARFRYAAATHDAQALWLTLGRIPAILRFRRSNRAWALQRHGDDFFLEPGFQARASR